MSEHLSSFGISVNRLKIYLVITVALFAVRGVCAQTFSEFAYVLNGFYGDDFSGYRTNIFTGELTPLPGSPFPLGPYVPEYATVNGLVIDSKDRFLYSLAVGGETFPYNGILGYSIGADGALTTLPSLAGSGGPYMVMALDPSNKFLYATGPEVGITGYSINAATGLLTPVPGSLPEPGIILDGLTIDPTGRFLYAQEFFQQALLGFKIDPATGALTPLPGSPFTGISGEVIMDPTGRFLYAFEGIAGVDINEYTIDSRTGALTLSPRSPFSAPVGVAGLAVDPTGSFLYVLDSTEVDTQASNQVVGFSINPFNGGLTRLLSSPVPTGSGTNGLAVDPTGRFVYVTNFDDNTVSGYAIEPRTGALRPLPGPPVPAGSGPKEITVGAFIGR